MTEFELKVKEMRESQKRYFATRSSEALRAAKAAEKAVDDILWQIEHPNLSMDQVVSLNGMFEFICDLVGACDYGTETLSSVMRERAEKLICEAYKQHDKAYKKQEGEI